jgi:phage terminase large subunit-like protein
MEFTHFSEYSFNYVRTRMRSDSKYRSFIRCGLNPHPNHFVHKYLKLFIDQKTGFAIKEFAAKPCYYIFDHGEIVTGWDYDELVEKYPTKSPRKFTFVPSSIQDNQFMLAKNENYIQDLEANDPANAAMLLSGNWKYTISPNGVWERSVIKGQIADHLPIGCSLVRAWDKAASKPAKEGGDSKTLDPDFTCSIGMARSPDKLLYVFGNYVDDNTGQQRARFREKPGIRDKYILSQCKYDGPDVTQILPCDLGQGGKFEYQESAKVLQSEGITVKKDPSISNASKMKRFDPFVAACFNGLVFWVKDSFSPEVWDYMLLELENFNPLTKNNGFHDDLVDCFSSAYAASINNRVSRSFTLPNISAPSLLAEHKARIK